MPPALGRGNRKARVLVVLPAGLVEKARIRLGPFDTPPARPFIFIAQPEAGTFDQPEVGSNTRAAMGRLEIVLEADVSDGSKNDGEAAQEEADNAFGDFLKMLNQQSGTTIVGGTRLMFLTNVMSLAEPLLEPPATADDNTGKYRRWNAKVGVEWGNS